VLDRGRVHGYAGNRARRRRVSSLCVCDNDGRRAGDLESRVSPSHHARTPSTAPGLLWAQPALSRARESSSLPAS
jgi:hypothetical protein